MLLNLSFIYCLICHHFSFHFLIALLLKRSWEIPLPLHSKCYTERGERLLLLLPSLQTPPSPPSSSSFSSSSLCKSTTHPPYLSFSLCELCKNQPSSSSSFSSAISKSTISSSFCSLFCVLVTSLSVSFSYPLALTSLNPSSSTHRHRRYHHLPSLTHKYLRKRGYICPKR